MTSCASSFPEAVRGWRTILVYALKELALHLNYTLDLLIVSEDELKGAQVVVLPRPGCVTRGMGGSQVVVLPRPWLCYQGKGPYCYLFD